MARAKPCRECGHSKTQHIRQNNGLITRCKYYYAARDGHNLYVGWDTDEDGFWKQDKDGRSARQYQCQCSQWLPEEKWRRNPDTDEMEFLGYEDGLNRDGTKPRNKIFLMGIG